ncbi:MepB family protein [Exiguobacterium sp. s168]|uniref:MepB family protein n=1 Tax=Exiguobacterium sp. s168 TaxID=2751194 RepID=UPI00064621FD|nr:MepB family protein [Exiguobacterium sp. s168]
MNDFWTAFTYINEQLYMPCQLTPHAIYEEVQNATYGAGRFCFGETSIRFRVAKVTPTKLGQFVVIWEKDEQNQNQPFSEDTATDLLVVNTFTDSNRFGQFVFPKIVLKQHNIFKTGTIKGKMAMRVYPSWDNPTSKQAIATQKWQLEYFMDYESFDSLLKNEVLRLYMHSNVTRT